MVLQGSVLDAGEIKKRHMQWLVLMVVILSKWLLTIRFFPLPHSIPTLAIYNHF